MSNDGEENREKPEVSSTNIEAVPSHWIDESRRQCVNFLSNTKGKISSLNELADLVKSFATNVEKPGEECFHLRDTDDDKFLQIAEKVESTIRQMLTFFNSMYSDIPEPKDSRLYLSRLSQLVALWIDLSISIFVQTNWQSSTSSTTMVSSKAPHETMISSIIVSLYSLLDKSESFVLDTVLKLKPPEKNAEKYSTAYAAIYRCVINKAQRLSVLNDFMYIKYKLVLQLWEKIAAKSDSHSNNVMPKWPHRPPGFFKRRRELYKSLSITSHATGKEDCYDYRQLAGVFQNRDINKQIQAVLHASTLEYNHAKVFTHGSLDLCLLTGQIPDYGPSIPLDPPIQSESPKSFLDELWNRLQCESPVSDSYAYNQVTQYEPTVKSNNLGRTIFNQCRQYELKRTGRWMIDKTKRCVSSDASNGMSGSSRAENGKVCNSETNIAQQTFASLHRSTQRGHSRNTTSTSASNGTDAPKRVKLQSPDP